MKTFNCWLNEKFNFNSDVDADEDETVTDEDETVNPSILISGTIIEKNKDGVIFMSAVMVDSIKLQVENDVVPRLFVYFKDIEQYNDLIYSKFDINDRLSFSVEFENDWKSQFDKIKPTLTITGKIEIIDSSVVKDIPDPFAKDKQDEDE